jgi:hypothetical protein
MGKRGPKAKGDYSSKGSTLSARITNSTRERLDNSARENGTSISQEVETRLLMSFEEAQRVEDAFGGRTTSAFLRVLAEQIRAIEAESGKHWWEDRYTFDKCVEVISLLMAAFLPKGKSRVPPTRSTTFPGTSVMMPTGGPLPAATHVLMALSSLRDIFNSDSPAPARVVAAALVPKLARKRGS